MQMNNMAELITVSKYWKRWSNPQWIVCVFNNEDLNQVTWEQRVMEGDPKFVATQQIPNVPYHKFGELIGLMGIFCNQEEHVGAAWEEAFASERPVVLEFKTDPEVPPLPSHITLTEGYMGSPISRPESRENIQASRRTPRCNFLFIPAQPLNHTRFFIGLVA